MLQDGAVPGAIRFLIKIDAIVAMIDHRGRRIRL